MTKPREAPELEAMMDRMLRALTRRCGEGELEALEALQRLSFSTKAYLALGVCEYRASVAQPSWRDLGRILNMSGQAVQQRFGIGPEQ